MEATCISVANPVSYLICYGIKDVENRNWTTDYRGVLYIHSSGKFSIRGMPDFSRYPMPVIHEFDDYMNRLQEIEKTGNYIGFVENGVSVFLKHESHQPEQVINEYNLLADVYNHYRKDTEHPFFYAGAIIGTAKLVDIVRESESPWAEPGRYHWILKEPVIFSTPIKGVREKSGLWTYAIPDAR